jgi:hypothetical protein
MDALLFGYVHGIRGTSIIINGGPISDSNYKNIQ